MPIDICGQKSELNLFGRSGASIYIGEKQYGYAVINFEYRKGTIWLDVSDIEDRIIIRPRKIYHIGLGPCSNTNT